MTAGGYQRPSSPAPVSGPGAKSKRTDGGPAQKLRDLPDAQYGEAATFRELQQGAPLAQSPLGSSPRAASTAGTSGGGPALTPLRAPTAYPEEPVTARPTGRGPSDAVAQDLDRLRRYLPALMEMASRPSSSPSFRNYVRMLRSKVG